MQHIRMPTFRLDHTSSRKIRKKRLLRLLRIGLGMCLIVFIVGIIWLQKNIRSQLPKIDASNLHKLAQFAQGSVVTDKNGVVLYKFFEENREYVSFSGFSQNMVNAAIATEDNTFWTNPGLDYTSLARAVFNKITNRTDAGSTQGGGFGASTISQQVVRNILLTREKTSIRRIKEVFLTLRLDNTIEDYLEKKYKNLSSNDLQKKKKQMIMELYLNMVFLGNSAYGAEAAAQTYFNKHAKDLDILESAILAGVIQAPSRYNPYTNRVGAADCNDDKCQGTIGGLLIKNQGQIVTSITGDSQQVIIKKATDLIANANLGSMTDNKALMGFLNGLLSTTVTHKDKIYTVSYERGRKDTVLTRMYKEGFIDQTQLKQALISGLTLQLHTKKTDIKAPHFVFWIKDLISSDPSFGELGLDAEALMRGGLKITTTLDYHIQQIAEKSLRDNQHVAASQGAYNSSFIYIDSKLGDVLAYVGSVDYDSEKIKGKMDMLREPRQPGSSIKPLVYSFGFQTIPLSLDTPIYDIPMRIGAKSPNDWDFKFPGLLPLREALARSRNIPAIKMYFGVGEEEKLKPYLQNLGLKHLKTDHQYGYSMSLGAGEVPMIEMAQAYAHISTLGEPGIINPIAEIRGPDGKIIYKKKIQKATRIVEKGPAYLIWKILSDPANMPVGWPSAMKPRVKFKNGMKSGTSNMIDARGKTRSRDATLMLMTPSKVGFGRVGNTDASPHEAYGRSLNGVFKQFFETLEKEKYMTIEDNNQPPDVRPIAINKLSGKPANGTPGEFIVSSRAWTKTMPGGSDGGMKEIAFDRLCGGLVSEYTPEEDVVHGYVITPTSFIPSKRDLNDIISWYKGALKSAGTGEKVVHNFTNILMEKPTKPCEERIPKEDTSIVLSVQTPQANQTVGISSFSINVSATAENKPIARFLVFLDGTMIGSSVPEKSKTIRGHSFGVKIPKNFQTQGSHMVKIMAIDSDGYSNIIERTIVLSADTIPPRLDPTSVQITPTADGKFSVKARFIDDMSTITKGKIIIDGNTNKTFSTDTVIFTIKEIGSVAYIVIDEAGNQVSGVLRLQEYYIPTPPIPPEGETPIIPTTGG